MSEKNCSIERKPPSKCRQSIISGKFQESSEASSSLQLEAGDDSAAVQLQSCMRKVAALQQKLLTHAQKEGIAVPEVEEDVEEGSQHSAADGFMWSQYILVGARDWQDLDDAGEYAVLSLCCFTARLDLQKNALHTQQSYSRGLSP